jgi:hypothetical protein
MGKKKKTIPPEEYYQKLTNQMLDHPAWKHLSGNAIKVYLMMRRVSFSTPDKFYLTYNTIEEAGIRRHLIKDILTELVECGFIEVVEHGGRTETGWNKNYYKISGRWKLCTDTFKPGERPSDVLAAAREKIFVSDTSAPIRREPSVTTG